MTRRLSPDEARRAAIVAQQLSSPRPTDIVETVRHLWMLQMDPTSAVARTEHLVLFSRLGPSYRPAALERALWTDRTLFEYRAYILPVDDLPIHKATMRSYPPRSRYARHDLGATVPHRERVVPPAHPAAAPRRGAAPLTRDIENQSRSSGAPGDGTTATAASG